jgi:hypothetical protein
MIEESSDKPSRTGAGLSGGIRDLAKSEESSETFFESINEPHLPNFAGTGLTSGLPD